MNHEGPLFHKPKRFLTARQTIYASIFVGVIALVLRTLSIGMQHTGGITAIGITVVFYIVIILLVKQMSLCHKWARTAVLILYVLAMVAYPLAMSEQMKTSMMVGALLVIEAALIIYAIVLLYNIECTKWFNSAVIANELP